MEIFTNSCSLDCFDVCKIDVYKEDNRVIKLEGNKSNKLTDGFLCSKGLKHLDRLYSKDRILKPLLKVNGVFKEISFEESLNIVKNELLNIKQNFGSESIIHYSESGAGGLLKGIEDIFFNFFGGISTASGGTCWSAGSAAQDYDFGDRKTSDLSDLKNAKVIILWSRNPAVTSIHLYKQIIKAKKNGTKIITVDFRKNESSSISDLHINLEAGSDGTFALALCKLIFEKKLQDFIFCNLNIIGLKEFEEYLSTLDYSILLKECNLNFFSLETFLSYISLGNVMTFIGYGLQRYSNGGNNVRCIDALMSITGNIGKKGAGIFYSSKVYPQILNRDPYNSSSFAKNSREFPVTNFSDFIMHNNIKAIFITKANPLTQLPNLNKTLNVYKSIPFKVCFDMFMTDTAKNSDLIIPVTNTLETEDIIYSSMLMPYLMYNYKVVEPIHHLMDEFEFFKQLALSLNLSDYPQVSKEEYLNKVLSPLKITLDDLKKQDINIQKGYIAWEDLKFKTPSGKIEIYSEKALKDGFNPLPLFIKTLKGDDNYPIRLVSPHSKESLFSQHNLNESEFSQIFISPLNFNNYTEGDIVKVSSKNGNIYSQIFIDSSLKLNEAYIFMKWHNKQGNPNFLTDNLTSDIGGQVAYYDTFINIK